MDYIKGESAFRDEVAAQNAAIVAQKTMKGFANLIEGQVPATQLVELSADVAGLDSDIADVAEDLATLDGVAVKTSDSAIPFPAYATESRPTVVDAGLVIFDSTLGYLILWNGSAWVNLDGTALV